MTAEVDGRSVGTAVARQIRTLDSGDVPQLRLGLRSMIDSREVLDLIRRHPGRSVWEIEGREFAVVAPWRHRDDISALHRWSAVRAASSLLQGAAERCRAAGDDLLLVMELDDVRSAAFYQRAGLEFLQAVITYELTVPALVDAPVDVLFRRVDDGNSAHRDQLLALDHAAFPWLWRNSAEEFATYLKTQGVTVYIGYEGQDPVSYLGLTAFRGWGHLDRIAVDPRVQGRGIGWASLNFAISTLAASGARRFALSTQDDNDRSQRMYERFGFRRSDAHDYRLYGAVLTSRARELLGQMTRPVEPLERDRNMSAVEKATLSE